MSVKQYIETEETYIFEEINNSIISYPLNGGPMWSGTHEERFAAEQYNNESLQVDEATTPMPEPMTPASNYGYEQPSSDNDLNNITPSLMPLMIPQMNKIGPPDRTPDPGLYNFAVLINSANTHKKKFLWSNKVRRMYVDAGIDFPLNFSWDAGAPSPAYVRAMAVFHDADQSQHRVETCLNHKSSLAIKNLTDCQLSNVLHSSREPGASEVFYCGGPGQWYSTVVRYHDNPRTHAYRFVCKNSCTGGINRRSIAIIFTLENEMGTVYGREIISVRVCACPRRDMKADEEHAPAAKKPRSNDSRLAEPRTKKVKIEPMDGDDDKIVVLPEENSVAVKKPRSTRTGVAEPRTKKVKIKPTDGSDDKIVVLPELRIRGVSTALRILEMSREFALQHKRLSSDARAQADDADIVADLDAKISELKNNK